MDFNHFLKLTSKIENIPLTGEASHYKMVPPFRRALLKLQNDAMKNAKRAGVLALFYPDNKGNTFLVLILRKTYKGVHSAQVSFPGGKLEKQDTSLETAAIRETFEEVGVPKEHIQVIKQLSEVYIPPSNFYVQPYLGVCRNSPNFVKQPKEVEAIIEVSLQHLLDDNNLINKVVKTTYSVEVEVPAFYLNNHVVWGATAMMLSEIKDLLKQML